MEPKNKSRKLNLNRETLAPLDADDLDGVNGGASVSVSWSRPWLSVSTFSLSLVKADSQNGGGQGGQGGNGPQYA